MMTTTTIVIMVRIPTTLVVMTTTMVITMIKQCVGEIFTCKLIDSSEISDFSVSVNCSSEMSLIFLFLDGV